MEQHTNEEAQKFAALDLGSNSFHLVIAVVTQGELRIRDAISEKVQLGAGIDEKNNISDEAQQRALLCLERYSELLTGLPQNRVRIVGTNTLRMARNSNQFLTKARNILGYDIEVIGGREEARLIYLGVSHTLADDEDSRMVIDIGGGSTEFIIGKRFEAAITESLHMGCVSYAKRFFEKKLSKRNFSRAVLAARQEILAIKHELFRLGWHDSVGASGTVRSIYNVLQKQGWSDDDIHLRGLYTLRDKVLSFESREQINIDGLSELRAPILPSGLAILIAIFESLKIDRMRYSTGALREGVLYDLLGRSQHEDVRDRTVHALMERYRVNIEHSNAVKTTALALLKQLGKTALLESKLADFLAWAAQLHQLGLSLSHSKFHRHGSYLIRYSDLPGFSKKEQTFLAALIRNHRRKYSTEKNNSLFPELESDFEVLSICLRLAVIFHRGQIEPAISHLVFSHGKKGYILSLSETWLQENPLHHADLEQEIVYLKEAGIKLKLH